VLQDNHHTIEQIGVVRKIPGKSLFTFDYVFDEDSSTVQVYDATVRPIVWEITRGKHGTVLCYGQTGSGKTFTMQGTSQTKVRFEGGILQLAAKDIFKWVQEDSNDSAVRISFFEIYNEQVRDLLSGVVVNDNNVVVGSMKYDNTILTVRDDPRKGGVTVNCREVEVKNMEQISQFLQLGNSARSIASTNMNQRSSRSHAIFRITVESQARDDGTILVSTLNLVDLAGSENSQTSDLSTPEQQREGGKINTSLLSLSKVMYALSLPPGKRPKYINYRDSNLTRILQPHLSGNALMAVLCCISSAAAFVEETRSTLRFASRAKQVETKASVNQVSMADENSVLVQKLRHDLAEAHRALAAMRETNALTENASTKSSRELKKIKSLFFGDENYNLDLLDSQAIARTKKKGYTKFTEQSIPTIEETRASSDTANKFDIDLTGHPFKPPSFQRITNRTTSHSYVTNEVRSIPITPPREVLIMTGEPAVGIHDQTSRPPQGMADHWEQRAHFLESRLEATEDLVDLLRDDLQSSRKALHHLVHKNVRLSSRIDKLHSRLDIAGAREHDRRESRYQLLKWSLYCSLFFFVFQMQDLFAVTVMFVWLTLESYTSNGIEG
jgi:centromeric protein E